MKKRILGLMFVLFAGPPIVAWWMYNFTDMGSTGETYNHGELILPPRQLDDLDLVAIDHDRPVSLHGKWSLVYFIDKECDVACDQILYVMRQVRLAMNNDAHRLQRVLISIQEEGPVLSPKQKQEYKGQLSFSMVASDQTRIRNVFNVTDDPLLSAQLYVVDPMGKLMMFYSRDSDPAAIIKDLKRLLRYSRIG